MQVPVEAEEGRQHLKSKVALPLGVECFATAKNNGNWWAKLTEVLRCIHELQSVVHSVPFANALPKSPPIGCETQQSKV